MSCALAEELASAITACDDAGAYEQLISLDWLRDRGLLEEAELRAVQAREHERQWALAAAARRFTAACAHDAALAADFAHWRRGVDWLEDYALFTAIREARGGMPWLKSLVPMALTITSGWYWVWSHFIAGSVSPTANS